MPPCPVLVKVAKLDFFGLHQRRLFMGARLWARVTLID